MSALSTELRWMLTNARDTNRSHAERALWEHVAMKLAARIAALGDFTSQYPYPSPYGHHLDHQETP